MTALTDPALKDRIKQVAVDHFDRYGFAGATIRNIAAGVPCSLPMVYYYYKNKQELFDEIIRKDYFDLLKRQAEAARDPDPLALYTRFVCSLTALSEHDRKVYRLGIKVYLHFDGDEALMALMDLWEKDILPRHLALLRPHLNEGADTRTAVRALIHLLENLVECIVVKNYKPSEPEVRAEIALILAPALKHPPTHL